MRAAYIREPGPADAIIVGELPDPEPTDTQVLVQVTAAALNPVDTYVRSGMIAMPLPLPFVVGCDLAGTVAKVGSNVRSLKVGDRVWGTNQGLLGRQGTFAQLAAVEECWLYPTPPGVTDEDAAAVSLVAITAHLGLVRDAALQPGETVFVNGGSGGVGSTVIQMAKALGGRVIATAGSDAKLATCRQLGAEQAIHYRNDDVAQRARDFAPQGVDVWWETTREPNLERIVDLLAERGRIVLMAGREARPEFPVGPFYVKGCRMYGFAMFKATPEEQRAAAEDINRWLSQGKLRPQIDRVVPLEETAAMHQLQEDNTIGGAGTLAGKIVVRP